MEEIQISNSETHQSKNARNLYENTNHVINPGNKNRHCMENDPILVLEKKTRKRRIKWGVGCSLLWLAIIAIPIVSAIGRFRWLKNLQLPCYHNISVIWLDNYETCLQAATICARNYTTYFEKRQQCNNPGGCPPSQHDPWLIVYQMKEIQYKVTTIGDHCMDVSAYNNIQSIQQARYNIDVARLNNNTIGIWCSQFTSKPYLNCTLK